MPRNLNNYGDEYIGILRNSPSFRHQVKHGLRHLKPNKNKASNLEKENSIIISVIHEWMNSDLMWVLNHSCDGYFMLTIK